MTFRWLALAGLLALACLSPAQAQQARVAQDCILAASLPTRDATNLMVDQNGKLCTAAPSGGSTGSVTPAGTSGTQAQAVQGITGGVPQAVVQQDAFTPAGSPFSASSATTLFTLDTTGYQSLSLTLVGTFSATVTHEVSNDGTNWIAAVGYAPSNSGNAFPLSSDTAATIRSFPITAKFFRSRISSYTSGTVSAVPVLRSGALSPIGVTIGAGSVSLVASSAVVGSTTLRAAGTNRSATVNTTAATLMSSNASRQGWKIKNDCANAIWISFDGTAAATAGLGNIRIPAGGYLASEPGFIETGAMSAIAETSACAVTAREH